MLPTRTSRRMAFVWWHLDVVLAGVDGLVFCQMGNGIKFNILRLFLAILVILFWSGVESSPV